MNFASLNGTVVAIAVAATVLTSSVATVTPVSAEPGFSSKINPLTPNPCLANPGLCGPGNIKLPPKPPAPPAPPAPKPGMSAGAAAAIGIVGGIIVGAAIANQQNQQATAHDATQAHYNWCFAKYKTYRVMDNSYQPYVGPRKPCISPYI
ncbi:BA14K family protein [Oricola sp.]|uniref:BA14K family protein n=1 Tax=Oricola sp. TaxID=1979950 RepID=UPI0025F0B10B|nr:BA14K family protein [Oricola sp.]MCI5075414.1 BA14K family protein [Oricola sp.]